MKLPSSIRTVTQNFGPIFLICVVAGVFRFHQLGTTNTWFDESSSCRWINFSASELIDRTKGDCHPPLYWLILKVWREIFGGSVGALRSMSVAFGIATIVSTYCLVKEICRQTTNSQLCALHAASLVGLSHFQIRWSQEMRMYSMGTFLVITATLLLYRGMQKQNSSNALWIGYWAVGVVSFFTLYFSVFIFLAHGIFVVLNGLWTGFWPKRFFIAAAGMVLAGAGWLHVVWHMFSTIQGSFHLGPLTWKDFSSLYSQMFLPTHQLFGGMTELAVLELCGVAILGLFATRSQGAILVGVCASFPLYAIINMSLISQNVIVSHRMILGQIFILIGFALIVSFLRPVWFKWSLMAATMVFSFWGASQGWISRNAVAELPGFRGAMGFIRERRSDEQLVLFYNTILYLNGIVYLGEGENIVCQGERFDFPYYNGSSLTRDSDHLRVDAIPKSCNAIWVVDGGHGGWEFHMPDEWEFVAEEGFQGEPPCFVKLYVRKVPSN